MVFSWKYLRVFYASLFVYCGLFTSALHADEQVRVRLFSPPPNLMSYLFRLDETEVFSREPGWVATEDVDLFVVFTSDFQDLDFVPEVFAPPLQVLARDTEKLTSGNQLITGVTLKRVFGDDWPLSAESSLMFLQVEILKQRMKQSVSTPDISGDEREKLEECMMATMILGAYDARFTGEVNLALPSCAGFILADR